MKKGFTLAEVLITLGIIGVIAALTAPALIQDAGSAKVGPTLAKAVTTLELANQNMLSATDAPSIKASPIGVNDDNKYIEGLSDYMKVTPYTDSGTKYSSLLKNYNGAGWFTGAPIAARVHLSVAMQNSNYAMTKDGLLYVIHLAAGNSNEPANRQLAGYVFIDINGKTKPNRLGKDAFAFIMMGDGTVKPIGGNQWSTSDSQNQSHNWQNGTDKCNETEVTSGWSCAGSIFENGLKVIY